jgi:signal transduction histidine kinase/DNA-binding response OmpR family regulator
MPQYDDLNESGWSKRDAFLRSPGQMGRRIAEFDWSSTPLGPIESWNDNLKTSLSLMLNSQHPIWIGWGDEATFFYNDAYIDVLSQAKHPGALGRPAHVVWAEIWDFCGPLAEKVFQQGEATFVDEVQLFMDRGSYLEETYFSFSYSPIADTNGKVSGLFCPSTEVSSKILNARRLRTLARLSSNALSERSIEAACATAAATLADNPGDIPFALIYLYRAEERALVLEQMVRIDVGGGASPVRINLDEGDHGMFQSRVRDAMQRGEQITLTLEGLGDIPRGLADQQVRELVLLPMTSPGADRPVGLVVAGVNPTRQLDTEYRTFFDLLVDQIDSTLSNARIAEEQHRQVEALAELDRAKTAFFSNVSHEFRTPLTLMLAPLGDAMRSAASGSDELLKERLTLMQRNALRLQKLVNTLLDFSRTQAGRMDASYAPVNLAKFTIDLASGFRSLIESTGMTLNVHCPELKAAVYVDPLMWEKIVLNLLSNAFKFTFEGSITLELAERDDMVLLSVEDTGVGIPGDALPRLFERFHRVEGARSRTHEGSGIGLALVKDLVELHGGSITAESEAGRGTRFEVAIPAGRDHLPQHLIRDSSPGTTRRMLADTFTSEAAGWISEQSHASEAPADNSHIEPAAIKHTGTILVVDDNPDMRAYLKRLLEEYWNVEIAANGRKALAMIAEHRPDVVLSDVMMPELDGFGLIAALKTDNNTASIPIILLSARAGDEARIEGLQAGASDYLVKPFSGPELVARVESQLQKARAIAVEQHSYRRMSRIFEQMPVAIAILRGPQQIFELANPAYAALIDNRPVVGLTIRQALPELAGQGVYEMLSEVYQTGQPFMATAYKMNVRNGPNQTMQECYFDIVWQPLYDVEGKVEAIAVVCTDVTAVTRAGQSLELASRTKDEFLAMLGHELRNPLAPISIALEIMRMRGDTSMARERAIIERQTQHMIRLVDDLLDVSRIAQGKIVLKLEAIEISAVAARAVELAAPLIEERRHVFRGEVAQSGLVVSADRSRLAQVLANLLTNAAKYTDPQGSIELRAYAEADDIVIEVEDSGIGISAASLPLIFDKFVQERQSVDRARGGIGLGLAIAKNITELHGGTLVASSKGVGLGSKFSVRLPRAGVADKTSEEGSATIAVIEPEAAREQRRVLVVDDNTDIVTMFEEVLRIDGYNVLSTVDPTAAIKLAADFAPDVALLDIGLPGMDGYQLVAELKRIPQLAETRFIAVTGYGQQADQQRAHEAGFALHLVKPVDIEDLRRVLSEDRAAA